MHPTLLSIHSLFRWLVLASLLFSIYRAFRGWFSNKAYSHFDNSLRYTTATIAYIQLTIGIWLYFISPTIDYFLNNFRGALGEREIRFFGMEHSSMMLVAVILISIGSSSAKRKSTDQAKFKAMAIWFTLALLIILINIPWPFSPMAERPYFRFF